MNSKYLITTFIIVIFIGRIAQAQQGGTAGPSDTLVVMWASGDPYRHQPGRFSYPRFIRERLLCPWFDGATH